MQKFGLAVVGILVALSALPSSGHSQTGDGTTCTVVDPTGTPLNIRATPNGRIVATVANRQNVLVLDSKVDSRGRKWVFINVQRQNRAIGGWVLDRFLRCPA